MMRARAQDPSSRPATGRKCSDGGKDGMMLPPSLDLLVFGSTHEKAVTSGACLRQDSCSELEDDKDTMLPAALEKIVFGGSPTEKKTRAEDKSSNRQPGAFPVPICSDKKTRLKLLMALEYYIFGSCPTNADPSESGKQVEELPAPRLDRGDYLHGAGTAQPGAFAVEGPGWDEPTVEPVASAPSPNASLARDVEPIADLPHSDHQVEEGLAVANPVGNDDLQMAQQLDEASVESSEDSLAKRGKSVSALGVLCIVIGAAISSTLLLLLKPKTSASEPPNTAEPSSIPPASSIKDHVLSLLPEQTGRAIEDEESPQAQAYRWLLEDPVVQDYPHWRLIQRYALATFYFALDGDNWLDNSGWLSYNVSECYWASRHHFEWTNVTSYYHGTKEDPCADAESGVFTHLWLYENLMEGTLPPEFFLLTSLKSFSLFSNEIQGNLNSIASLTNLEAFCVTSTPMAGTLPTQIGLLTKLEAISMANSDLSGEIPSQMGLLTAMHSLCIDESRFTGTIPTSLGAWTNMRTLQLQRSQLSGPLPSEMGQWTALEALLVQGTELSASIPPELSAWKTKGSLVELNLEDTWMTGTIPDALCSTDKFSFTCSHASSDALCGCNCTCGDL